jgi:hypothetical protein
MTKELWINLPVKDVKKSKEFFTLIGFTPEANEMADMTSVRVGEKNISVVLIAEETLKGLMKNEISDTKAGSEVFISFDAESREEVDETARKVFEAGGTIFSEPAEIQGWMYGCGFADLDGHRWNVLYMDFSKLPKQ